MKRKLTKVLTLALAALLLLGSASAVSASEVTSSAPHYIDVRLKYDEDTYVTDQNVHVQLVKVADVKINGDWKDMSYTLTPEFAGSGVTISGYDDTVKPETVDKLYQYLLKNPAKSPSLEITKTGHAKFGGGKGNNLEEGLYLISQIMPDPGSKDYDELFTNKEIYTFNPFLISLPMPVEDKELGTVGGDRVYAISPMPKPEVMKPVDLKAVKIWQNAKPSDYEKLEIQVQFIGQKDGFPNLIVEPITLDKSNNWTTTAFKEFGHYYPDGYKWSMRELKVPEGYKESYPDGKWLQPNGDILVRTYEQKVENKLIPPTPPLIQTGQLNWPIPLLAGFGLLMMITGVVVLRHGRKKQ